MMVSTCAETMKVMQNVPSELEPDKKHFEFDLSFSCKSLEKSTWKYQWLKSDTKIGVFKSENFSGNSKLTNLLLYCSGLTHLEVKPTKLCWSRSFDRELTSAENLN